jgi:S-adenosylmethionine hydrolase
MIVLFTDFGWEGPYVGQLKAALIRDGSGLPIVDLMHDAPAFNPRASAYLLAALVEEFPLGTVFLGVVDPGVGDPQRRPAVVHADGRWFVGPDNGLFNVVAMRSSRPQWWDITWQPPRMSRSFHGRDLFAPVAARVARGEAPPGEECAVEQRIRSDWPAEFAEIIYIDHFGNAVTGLRTASTSSATELRVGGCTLMRAGTFAEVPPGEAFWYENSNGLVEIAVNQARADKLLHLGIGDAVELN